MNCASVSSSHPAAVTANQRQQSYQLQLPKDNSPRMSGAAPPPYTPPARHPYTSLHPFTAMASRGIPLSELQQTIPTMQRTITTHTLNDSVDESYCSDSAAAADALEAGVPFVPLTMRINTSINISKDNNIVCLSDSPTHHANAIAAAITKAIDESSSGNCGIPMVDGDGNPRPIKIEVDAGLVVDGQNNLVGTESAVLKILQQREEQRQAADLRRRRESVNGDEDEADKAEGQPSVKRRRSS